MCIRDRDRGKANLNFEQLFFNLYDAAFFISNNHYLQQLCSVYLVNQYILCPILHMNSRTGESFLLELVNTIVSKSNLGKQGNYPKILKTMYKIT